MTRIIALGKSVLPAQLVFFNGYSERLKKERASISEYFCRNNTRVLRNHFEYGEECCLAIPCFAPDYATGGLCVDTARNGVLNTDIYVEPVGDGFGNTSYDMAMVAYRAAKEVHRPTLVLVKKEREAKRPEYATRFLEQILDVDILFYTTPEEFVEKFEECFKGKLFR